jgi:hypothetical protein
MKARQYIPQTGQDTKINLIKLILTEKQLNLIKVNIIQQINGLIH